MGLSSSQARLLNLTARMHQIEYKAAKLEAQKLQMANESRRVYDEYLTALDSTKIQLKTINDRGAADYIDATYNSLIQAGYKIEFLEEIDNNKPQLVNEIVQKNTVPSGYTGIYTADEFMTTMRSNPSGNYILMGDLDFSGVTIDYSNQIWGFSGTLDGNGYSIKNFNIDSSGDYVGLISETAGGAVIKNLIVDNASVISNGGCEVGILVGGSDGDITIDNCTVTGAVGGSSCVGGLIGLASSGVVTINNTFVNVNASGDSEVGGFIGYSCSDEDDINYSCVNGTIEGNNNIGGFIGAYDFTWIEYSYSTCTITGNNNVGSICGQGGTWDSLSDKVYTTEYHETGSSNPWGGNLISEAELNALIADGTLKGISQIPVELRNSTEWLTNMVNAGAIIISKPDNKGNFFETSVAIDTGLQEVSDETLLRKAEAKYEADMRKIDRKDRMYDHELAALDNERNAIKAEMETLKTVAKDNVERTFKLFS